MPSTHSWLGALSTVAYPKVRQWGQQRNMRPKLPKCKERLSSSPAPGSSDAGTLRTGLSHLAVLGRGPHLPTGRTKTRGVWAAEQKTRGAVHSCSMNTWLDHCWGSHGAKKPAQTSRSAHYTHTGQAGRGGHGLNPHRYHKGRAASGPLDFTWGSPQQRGYASQETREGKHGLLGV